MDRQNVIHPYNVISSSHNREWSIDICYNMDKSQKHAKWKKLVIEDHISYDPIHVKCPE